MGYNGLDNYLYAQDLRSNLLKTAADGTSEVVATLSSTSDANVGAIDTNGQYWYGTAGSTWNQVDLVPGSATYGEILASGTAYNFNLITVDWVVLSEHPNYLYTIAIDPADSGSTIARFSTTRLWEIVSHYTEISISRWDALYSASGGRIFASDDKNGDIWVFSVDCDDTSLTYGYRIYQQP
jgi:hypothetical protein